MFQVEIKKAEPRDSNKMNDVGANQWGMNQNNHLAMGVCYILLLLFKILQKHLVLSYTEKKSDSL